MSVFDDLADSLNGHQVTDDDGQVKEGEGTPGEDAAIPEETETATAEKPTESEESATKAEEPEEEPNIAEDDKGRKYIPEKRFKEVYGKAKKLERELEELKRIQNDKATKPVLPFETNPAPLTKDKNVLLENELLFTKMPEFDPNSDQYDPDLDAVAANIWLAKGGEITKLEAARQAKKLASKITEKVSGIKAEAHAVKASQAESPITSRVTSREASSVDVEKMSLEEYEKYLKETGNW